MKRLFNTFLKKMIVKWIETVCVCGVCVCVCVCMCVVYV